MQKHHGNFFFFTNKFEGEKCPIVTDITGDAKEEQETLSQHVGLSYLNKHSQLELNMQTKHLQQDVRKRWNSTYQEPHFPEKAPVYKVEYNMPTTLSASQWGILERAIAVQNHLDLHQEPYNQQRRQPPEVCSVHSSPMEPRMARQTRHPGRAPLSSLCSLSWNHSLSLLFSELEPQRSCWGFNKFKFSQQQQPGLQANHGE